MSEGVTPSRSGSSAIFETGDDGRDWTPRPWPTHGRPRGGVSRTIVERLAADIDDGCVRPGQKLPPQRLLALRLGVTPGSVARAYAEAERRGLVRGEVGRGTFVRPQERFESWCLGESESELPLPATGERYDLRLNHPPTGPEDEVTGELETALRRALGKHAGGDLLGAPGRARASQANAVLDGLRRPGRALPLESTFLTASATAGLSVCLDQVARPGDTVLCERWTYPGLRALAASRSLKLIGVEQDAYGLIPEAAAQAVSRYRPAAIYCGPNLQNPTGALMTLRRRVELAALVERAAVPLLEDDVYGPLLEDPLPTVTSLVPEWGFYVTNLSKSLAPGLRMGVLQVPAERAAELETRVAGQQAWAAPVTVAALGHWVREGVLERAIAQRRRQAAARQALLRTRLRGASFDAHPNGFHVWLALPEPWSAPDFERAAARLGIALQATQGFRVDGPDEARVRLCLGQEPSIGRLDRSLELLSGLLHGGPEGGGEADRRADGQPEPQPPAG